MLAPLTLACMIQPVSYSKIIKIKFSNFWTHSDLILCSFNVIWIRVFHWSPCILSPQFKINLFCYSPPSLHKYSNSNWFNFNQFSLMNNYSSVLYTVWLVSMEYTHTHSYYVARFHSSKEHRYLTVCVCWSS